MDQGSTIAPMLVRVVLALGLFWHAAGDITARVQPAPHHEPAAIALGLVRSSDAATHEPAEGARRGASSGRILATNARPTPDLGLTDADAAPTGPGMTRLHRRTLAIHAAATGVPHAHAKTAPDINTDINSDSETGTTNTTATTEPRRVLPEALGTGRWPAILAWLSIVLQLIAAGGLLVGLLTRLAAGVVLIGLGAHLWIGVVGPFAVAGQPLLPAGGLFSAQAGAGVLLPLGAILLALACLAAGSGAAGIDHVMSGETDEYDTDD